MSSFVAALLAPLAAAALLLAGPRVRRLLRRHRSTAPVAAFAALLALLFVARAHGWAVGALLGLSAALASVAVWAPVARRRGWGSPSTLPRRWDWDQFDAQFQSHIDHAGHRRRREPNGGA
jgi:hypothetical protein